MGKYKVRYKQNNEDYIYDPDYLLTLPHEPPESLVGPFSRCKDCSYCGHGFICWSNGESCIRTKMEEIYERERRKRQCFTA